MKARKARAVCAVLLLLLGLVITGRRSAAGQTPQPTPTPDPRYAEAEQAFSEAASLYAEHTPQSMKAALESAEKARKLFGESSAPLDEALSLLLLSHVHNDLNDKRAALRNSQGALPLIRKVKEKELEATTLRRVGVLHAELGEPRKALEAYKQALAVYRELGDRKGEAAMLDMLAQVYKELGEKRKALEYLNQTLSLRQNLPDKEGTATALNNVGALYSDLGEGRKALEYLSRALPLMRELGNKAEEATTLFNLGRVYQDSGEREKALGYYHEALSLYKAAGDQDGAAAALHNMAAIHSGADEQRQALEAFDQLLPLKRALGDKRGEALALSYIGKLREDLGEPRKALEAYQQALAIYRESGDMHRASVILNRLGGLYDGLGEKQKAAGYFEQALSLRRSAGDRAGELLTLRQVGTMYETAGEGQRALEYYSRALLLAKRAGDKTKESQALNDIGLVYDDLGEKRRALEYFAQALRLSREAGDGGDATILNNMGKVYDALGEPQKALEHLNQALSLRRAGDSKSGEATTLNNIGMVYADLGEMRKALGYLGKALELHRGAGERRQMALVLGNMGIIYFKLDEEQKALEHTEQALQLSRAGGDKAAQGRFLSNIGRLYLARGERQKALEYLDRALPLRRATGDKTGEAATLKGLAAFHFESGEFGKSSEYLLRSLLLETASGDKVAESYTLDSLAATWEARKNRRLAIFYGKRAVARYQELRGAMREIDRPSQKSFLRSVETAFRRLSALLLEDGRLAEAHQILNVFKDQEFYDSLRPRNSSAAQARLPSLTRREREAAEMYRAAADRAAAANRPLLDLEFKLKNRKPTADEERRLRQLRALSEAADEEARATLKRVEAGFARPAPEQDKLAATSDTAEMQTALRELSRQTNSPTVALYTVGGTDDKFYVLLITPDKLTSVSTTVSPFGFVGGIIGDRRAKRDGLWLLLQSPFHDPRPQAREIYDIVFKPIEPEIKLVEAEARRRNPEATVTLMWSLDWYLRYIPMGVLYDGERYLAERYRNVVFTRANRERMTRPVSENWTGLGFGSAGPRTVKLFGETKSYEALPGVEMELAALFGTEQGRGVMTGRTWLDEQFTREAFLTALKQRRPLVHLASHFTFEPGDEARSFLLLGQGELLTLEEMKTLEGLFAGVDLLTLSACNTGAQQLGAQGREIDGFAELAQRLGAGAVLATLWPVSDASTPELMVEFYRLRQERRGMTKAEALRQAQMALLKGTVPATPRPAAGEKGAARPKGGRADIFGLREEPVNTPRFQTDPKAPWAHPYYWGGFVLMGNAR